LSSLILSGQVTRDEALSRLEEPLYQPHDLETDVAFFCKKLKLSPAEFKEMMAAPIHHYSEFPNWNRQYGLAKRGQALIERVTGRRLNVYS